MYHRKFDDRAGIWELAGLQCGWIASFLCRLGAASPLQDGWQEMVTQAPALASVSELLQPGMIKVELDVAEPQGSEGGAESIDRRLEPQLSSTEQEASEQEAIILAKKKSFLLRFVFFYWAVLTGVMILACWTTVASFSGHEVGVVPRAPVGVFFAWVLGFPIMLTLVLVILKRDGAAADDGAAAENPKKTSLLIDFRSIVLARVWYMVCLPMLVVVSVGGLGAGTPLHEADFFEANPASPDTDPQASLRGGTVARGGFIFIAGTFVDTTRMATVTKGRNNARRDYCVAPIVGDKGQNRTCYWAAGRKVPFSGVCLCTPAFACD